MAAESLGELVLAIEADNSQLKRSLKESERLTQRSGQQMSKSLDKVRDSAVDAGTGFELLDKAAAATGLTFLSQIKAVGELVFALGKANSLIKGATAARVAETAVVAANTRAINLNTVSVVANLRARSAFGGGGGGFGGAPQLPGGGAVRGLLEGAVGGAAASGASRIGRAFPTFGKVASGVGRLAAGAGRLAAGAATVGGAAIGAVGVGGAVAISAILRHRSEMERLNETTQKAVEMEGQLARRAEATIAARQKTIDQIRQQTEIVKRGLTGTDAERFILEQSGLHGDVKAAQLENIRAREQAESRAVRRRMDLNRLAKEEAESKARQAQSEAKIAREQERQSQLAQVRSEIAAKLSPGVQFEEALFAQGQAQEQRQRILRGALDALRNGKVGADQVAQLIPNLVRSRSSVAAGARLSSSFSSSAGSLGTDRNEIVEELKDSKDILKSIHEELKKGGGLSF